MSEGRPSVLVVGGTGPTGRPIVNGFLREGYAVTIYHTGQHEIEFDGDVEHLHGDPRDNADIAGVFKARSWTLAVCTSGRLRSLASELIGKVERLVGITGQPVYQGAMKPTPLGTLLLPLPESAVRQSDAANYTGKVAAGEDQLFEQHARGDFETVVVRYPGVYGPHGHLNHEWAIVKRVLDGRRRMAMPHGGMAYFQRGYVENLGRLVYLAATVPAAAGEAFNGAEEQVMNARQVAEVILDELGTEMELVDVPSELCPGSYPLAQKSSIILSTAKARELLGYRDVVGVEEATRLTARWLYDNPEVGRATSPQFGGSMAYEDEDRLIDWYRSATGEPPAPATG